MGVKSCPDCGGKVSTRAAACPHCGAPVTGRGSRDARRAQQTIRDMNVIGDAINGVSADDDSVDPGVLETYAEIGDMLADGKKFSFRNFAIAIVAGLILALVAGGIVSAKMPRGQGYDMHGRPTWSPQAREWQAKQASIGVGIAVFMAVSLLTYQCLPRKREE